MSEQENKIQIEGFDGFGGFGPEEEKKEESVETEEKEKLEVEVEAEAEVEVEAEAEVEEDKSVLKNIELSDIKAVDIVYVSPLEPMVIYVKTEEKDGSSGEVIGVCGFYDPENQQFVLSEVRPVVMKGFDEAFRSFIERKQKEKQIKVEEPKSK